MSGLGLAAAGTLGGVSACGGGSGGGSGGGLSFTYWGTSFEKAAVEAAAREFEQDNEGFTIDGQHVTGDYDTKMNTLLAARNEPDIGYVHETMAMRLADQGKLASILDFEDKHPEIGDLLPNAVHQWEEGKALSQIAVEMALLWYNVELFDGAGVEVPPADPAQAWSWDEFVEAADQLTVDENGRHPSEDGFDHKHVQQWGTLAPTWEFIFYGLLHSNGADLVNEDGTVCTLDSPEAVEVLQSIADLMHVHRVAPTPTQSEAIAATSAVQMKTKRVAMILDGQWQLLDLGKSGFEYGVGFSPKFQEPRATFGTSPNVIFSTSKQQEKAVEFLLYLYDPDKVSLYADGLWMPMERKYYTDRDAIDSWIDNPVHPEGFEQAAIEGALNYGVAIGTYLIKNNGPFEQRYLPVLDRLWTGKERDAKKVAADAVKAAGPQLQGLYPGPMKS